MRQQQINIIQTNTLEMLLETYSLVSQLYSEIKISKQQHQHTIEQMLKNNYYFYIARYENPSAIIAFAACIDYWTFDVGLIPYVQDIVVDEKYRNQGIGRALLEWIKNESIERGAQYFCLNAEVKDTDAQNFYKKLNFDLEAFHFMKKLI